MKKKRRMDEVTRKKKRRSYDEESSDFESSGRVIDIEDDLHDIIVSALEDEDWTVSEVIELLTSEIKFVVGEYE
jgi:hypothetical protein